MRKSTAVFFLSILFFVLSAAPVIGGEKQPDPFKSGAVMLSTIGGLGGVNALETPNEAPGVPLPTFSPFGGYLSYNSAPQSTYFHIYLAAGQQINLMLYSPPGADFDIYIMKFDGSGQQSAATANSPEYLYYTAATNGYYLICFDAYFGSGNYSVSQSLNDAFNNYAGPVHRFYKFNDGVHFYTADSGEATYINNNLYSTYRYEGTRFNVLPFQGSQSTPVYRFYNFINGVHFYTTNWYEAMDVLGAGAWTFEYEGTAFQASSIPRMGFKPVYRFYNFIDGAHFYTDSEVERQNLLSGGSWTFRYETIAFYVPI